MRKLLSCTAFTAAVATLLAPAVADDPKPVDQKLEGGYTVYSGEESGKTTPPEKIRGGIVRFTKTKIVGTDKDKKEFFAADYTVDWSKKPAVIRMKSTSPKEGEASGLIKKEGDTITVIYALPGGDMPTEFKTKPMQNLFVLKNMHTGDKPKPDDK